MFVLKSDKVLYVDVDNTLVTWHGEHYSINQRYVTQIKQFHKRGQAIIVWSAGGYGWAEKAVKLAGLESVVSAILSKPSWFSDDLPASEFMPEANRIHLKD